MPGTEADLATVVADPRRAAANAHALAADAGAEADLVDVAPASEVLGLERGEFLHAGPPIDWDRARGPLRGALIGAVLLEGLADDPEDAERAPRRRRVHARALPPPRRRRPDGRRGHPVDVDVRAARRGARPTTYCSLNEGLGKVLRYGAYGPEVIDRLRWMRDVLGPSAQARPRDAGRSTSGRSSPRCCRWATRATTATAPAR